MKQSGTAYVKLTSLCWKSTGTFLCIRKFFRKF